jgi:hypothetical protein
MGYYVSLPGESMTQITSRYRKSGIFAASSCVNNAHKAAEFLFPYETRYLIVNDQGKMVMSAVTYFSYWESILNRPVPNFASLRASDRAFLYIPSGL